MPTWIELIAQAKQQGLSAEEIRMYLKKAANGNSLPKEKQFIS